jgi:hypothetical protein
VTEIADGGTICAGAGLADSAKTTAAANLA